MNKLNITLLSILVLTLFVIFLVVPLMCDDLLNSYQVNKMGYFEYISYNYNNWTGRLQNLLLLGLVFSTELFVVTKFVIISIFILVPVLVFLITHKKLPSNALDFLLILFCLAFLWFCTSALDENIFWITGAIVYLIPTTLFLLLVYLSNSASKSIIFRFSIFLLSIFTFLGLEQITIYGLIFFGLYSLSEFKIKSIVNNYNIIFCGALISTFIMALSPGNYVRLKSDGQFSSYPFKDRVLQFLDYLVSYFNAPHLVFLGMMGILVILNFQSFNSSISLKQLIAKFLDYKFIFFNIISVVICVIFIVSINAVYNRTQLIFYIVEIMLFCKYLANIDPKYPNLTNKKVNIFITMVLIIFSLDILYCLKSAYYFNRFENYRHLNRISLPDGTVEIKKLPPKCRLHRNIYSNDITEYPENIYNLSYAHYLKLDKGIYAK